MVKSQIEFNEKHPKEKAEKVIRIREEKKFKGQLVVEDYPNLEKLYLREVKSVDKIILRNLTSLQECTIRDCCMERLVIENCSQIKKLNIENNLLTNLDFIKDLKNLEELKLDGNAELNKILEPYQGNWRTYQKIMQGSNEDIQKLLQELSRKIQSLEEENKNLKEDQPVTIDSQVDFEKKYQKLKENFNSLLKKEKIKTEEIEELERKTNEISSAEKKEQNDISTSDLYKKIKEEKNNLFNLKKTNRELNKKLTSFEQFRFAKKEEIKQKEKELEKLKKEYAKKTKFSFIIKSYNEKKIEEKIGKILEFQRDIVHCNNSLDSLSNGKEEIKNKLVQKTRLLVEELDKICQLQTEITQLELEIQKNFNQIYSGTFNFAEKCQVVLGNNNQLSQNNNSYVSGIVVPSKTSNY